MARHGVAHHTSKVISYLDAQNIEYVQKSQNAPNVPQARVIERFWALCKAKYSDRPNPTSTFRGFKRLWQNISKEFAHESGIAVMESAYKRLRKIEYNGVE